MELRTPRFVIRDFREADREAFVTYQMDPRYRTLYDLDDDGRAHKLFDRFMSWQNQDPRRDIQVGIFAADTGRLRGCCGLRMSEAPEGAAVLGIELTPDDWGAYRLAVDVASALIEYAFSVLDLDLIVGRTASGNRRVERLARWFGAASTGYRDGPEWMALRGWFEVDWTLDRNAWCAGRSQAGLVGPTDRVDPRGCAEGARRPPPIGSGSGRVRTERWSERREILQATSTSACVVHKPLK